MELIITEYQSILFNTARIFSSVFEIVLAYILTNSFFTFRFAKKRFDFVPFVALAGVMILLQENGVLNGLAAHGAALPQVAKYAIECAALVALLFLLYSDPPKRKLLGGMIFTVMIAVAEIAATLFFTLLSRRFALAGDEAYLLLARSGLTNLIMILAALLTGVLSKHYRRSETSLLLWIVLLSVPAITLLTFSVYKNNLKVAGTEFSKHLTANTAWRAELIEYRLSI